jgi:hypothetical protein
MDSQTWSSKCLLKKLCFLPFWGQTRGKNSLEVVWEIKGSSFRSHSQKSIFTSYVGRSPYWGYVWPFYARGRPIFSFVFFSVRALVWYRERGETPQEVIFSFLGSSVNPVHNAPRRSPTRSFTFPTPVHFHLLRPLEPHPHPLPPPRKK